MRASHATDRLRHRPFLPSRAHITPVAIARAFRSQSQYAGCHHNSQHVKERTTPIRSSNSKLDRRRAQQRIVHRSSTEAKQKGRPVRGVGRDIEHSEERDMAQDTGMALPAELRYIQYDASHETTYLPAIRALIAKDLSEPYSIYVYRYFLYQWGDLCFMVRAPKPSMSYSTAPDAKTELVRSISRLQCHISSIQRPWTRPE
jgi:hypothetical protein